MPSQSQYIAEIPAGDFVPKSIVKFFERLYQISDSPGQHEEFAGCFTEDGVIVFGSSRLEGRKGSFVSTSSQTSVPESPILQLILRIRENPRPTFATVDSISSFPYTRASRYTRHVPRKVGTPIEPLTSFPQNLPLR